MRRLPLVLLAAMSFPVAAWAADTACGTPHSTRDAIADGDLTRNLQCESYSSDARAMQLCCALEKDLSWSWWGHAIVSPGWRIDWDGVRDVYCRQKVDATDVDTLTRLSRGDRSQLQSGAGFLLRLVQGDDDATSIFNPQNPQYLLRGGCH